MRVLESGGTVEQHKAAVAALKFGTAVGSSVSGSDPCDVSGSFLSHRGLGPASAPGGVGVAGGLPVSASTNPVGSGPTGSISSSPGVGGNLKKGFSKYPPTPEDMAASMYGKGPGLMVVASQAPHATPGNDLNTLEAEISELQRENARVESQMLRLRTDISAMEAHLRHDKEPPALTPNLTEYYESFRNNVMSLLEQVRLPKGPGLVSSLATRGSVSEVRDIPPHFDSYLSKLQTLCEEGAIGITSSPAVGPMVGSVVAPMLGPVMGPSPGRTLYGAVRSTLPTPT